MTYRQELVEAAAREIADRIGGDDEGWQTYHWEALAAVHAVLAKLREPSEGMVEAGHKAAHLAIDPLCQDWFDEVIKEEDALAVAGADAAWRAMLDAVEAEG